MSHNHLIQKYFANNLTTTEKEELKNLVATDDQVAELFAVGFIGELSKQELTDKEKYKLMYEQLQKKKTIRRIIYYATSLAAGVALLIGISLFYANHRNDYEVYNPNTSTTISSIRGATKGAVSQTDVDLAIAQAFAQHKYYKDAIDFFEKSLQSDTLKEEKNLAIGICYVELDENQKALTILTPLFQSQTPVNQHRAMWFAAWAYHKMKNKENAKKIFTELSESASPEYADKAKKVLQEFY